jgi:hypothetical protein
MQIALFPYIDHIYTVHICFAHTGVNSVFPLLTALLQCSKRELKRTGGVQRLSVYCAFPGLCRTCGACRRCTRIMRPGHGSMPLLTRAHFCEEANGRAFVPRLGYERYQQVPKSTRATVFSLFWDEIESEMRKALKAVGKRI